MLDRITDGRTDLVFDLIDQGHLPSTTDKNGTPLIAWCAYYGDVSAVKYLVKNGVPLTELGDNYDLTGAAFHGHWQLCQYLLEQGADANHRSQHTGETALHAATSKAGRPAYNMVVKLLLAYDSDPNCKTIPDRETESFMRDVRSRGETPLHRAAAFGNEEMIELLLNAGADKTAKDLHGDTPLSWASWHLRPAAILSMLCYGKYAVNQMQVKRYSSDHGAGWGNGMEVNLLGKVHVE